MNSVALALLTFGVCLTVLLVAVLAGEVIYRWVRPHPLNETHVKGSKAGVFELGEQDVSEGVEALMEKMGRIPVMEFLRRHQSGDWGEIDDENRRLNGLSLAEGGSLGFESVYTMENGTRLRILTFEEGSGTLLLTEEEYQGALLSMDKEDPQEEGALQVRSLRDCMVRKSPHKEG